MSSAQTPQTLAFNVVLLYNKDFPPDIYETNIYPEAYISLADANTCARELFDDGADTWQIPRRSRFYTTRADGRVAYRGVGYERDEQYVVWTDRVFVEHPRTKEMVREWEKRRWQADGRFGEGFGLCLSLPPASEVTR